MKLVIDWTTPEELLDQVAQVFYIAAYSHRADLNTRLEELHGNKPIELELKSDAEKAAEPKKEDVAEKKKEEKSEPKSKAKTKANIKSKPKEEPEEDKDRWEEVTKPAASMDGLRQAFVAKNTPTNRPKLKAILAELGVAKVTELPEENWDDALEKLEAI